MLDRYIVPIIKPPLRMAATVLQRYSVNADQVTVAGFALGLLSIAALVFDHMIWALFFLLMNRLADGLDGELARLQQTSDAGGFLDIVLDFIFYALFPIGFALLDPPANALPAAVLIASFVGTGASFLAFASMANKHGIEHPDFAYKSLYYLNGLAEGSETIACFVLMCLLPDYFAQIAWVFAGVCVVTTINRVVSGYLTLRRD